MSSLKAMYAELDRLEASKPKAARKSKTPRKPKAKLPKLVKSAKYTRGGKTVEAKRDCTTGYFVPKEAIVNDCNPPTRKKHTPWWQDTRAVMGNNVCYPTRALALRVFADSNRRAIDAAGGMDQVSTDGSWDAVNERTGRRGKRKVKTVRQAIEAVMPTGRPYCLDRVDIDTLNETRPAREAGGFHLPDFVEEHKLLEQQEREYRMQEEGF